METAKATVNPVDTIPRPIHMIRADLNVIAFHRWAGSRGLIARNAFDEGFAMHCLLVESFGDRAPKPFRLIIPRDPDSRGVLLGYSSHDADALRDAAAMFTDPLQARVLPASGFDSKPMPAFWKPARRLGFEVLVRPIVRRSRGAEHPGAEIDAFQWEASRHSKDGMEQGREEVYTDWLAQRLGQRGAQLDEARLKSFQRVRTIRKLRAHATEGPHAVMRGTITIVDPGKFTELVAHGIGRHRAYGYGMLLLRPAPNPTGS